MFCKIKPAYLFSKLSPFVLNYTIKVGNLSSVRHVVSVIEDEKKDISKELSYVSLFIKYFA
ncbi:UNVERIFIED_CONTAM: hypothetical protein NCL1_35746 [Trichonephila clavipes]